MHETDDPNASLLLQPKRAQEASLFRGGDSDDDAERKPKGGAASAGLDFSLVSPRARTPY
jgi:hypothetical protein